MLALIPLRPREGLQAHGACLPLENDGPHNAEVNRA